VLRAVTIDRQRGRPSRCGSVQREVRSARTRPPAVSAWKVIQSAVTR
jgi:hypothetical protein